MVSYITPKYTTQTGIAERVSLWNECIVIVLQFISVHLMRLRGEYNVTDGIPFEILRFLNNVLEIPRRI